MHKSLFAVTALTACGPSPEHVAREQALKQLEQAAKGDVGTAMTAASRHTG